MKKTIFKFVSVMLLCATLLGALSGCYSINSGKMRSIEGTYELTNYHAKRDVLLEDEVVMYLVLNSTGTGYYAYGDKDTETYYDTVSLRFTADTEKSGYYTYVEVCFVGDEWFKLGINSRWNNKNLNSSLPTYKGSIFDGTFAVDYYTNVDFTRVSRKTDMSYINYKLGELEQGKQDSAAQ